MHTEELFERCDDSRTVLLDVAAEANRFATTFSNMGPEDALAAQTDAHGGKRAGCDGGFD